MHDSADDHAVKQHRHQRGQPEFFAQAARAERGQQRGQRTEHDIENRAAAEDVGQQAAHQQRGHGLRHQDRQQGKRLGEANLHLAVAQRGQQNGQRGIQRGDDGAASQRTGVLGFQSAHG